MTDHNSYHDDARRLLGASAATAPLAAQMSLGSRISMDLYGEPRAGQVPVPGTAAFILGHTTDMLPVVVVSPSIEYLDALLSAIQVARAQAIVEAGMAVRA